MFRFLLFLLYLSINTAAVVGDPMLVKRRCVGGCYPDDEQHCAAKTDAENYKEFPVNKCIRLNTGGFEKIECNGDTYQTSFYVDEKCTDLRYSNEEEKLGCQLDDDEIGMRAQLLQELPNNELEIELCRVNENCNIKYNISSNATECTSLSNDNGHYYMTWGSKGELILYDNQTKCNAKDLISAVMIAPAIRNKKPVVYYPSTFITCNGLPAAAPPKKLEIFKCADSTCGECAPEDSGSYESYTSGECLYNPNDGMYSKYECTKTGMVLTEYRVLRANGINGCTPGHYTTTTSYLGGCSRPFVMRGRSYGADGSGVIVELCSSTTCSNYTLVKGTTTCTPVNSGSMHYTWKENTLVVYWTEEQCQAENKFEQVFVATGFDKPTPTVVYENSVQVLCGGEGENPLPPRTSEVPLVIAACGDGNPTDAVDTCGVKKEGQCVSRSMTTGKCLWDDINKFYYMAVCNSTTYGIYNMGEYACETSINGKTTIASVEWGKTGCAELSRRARVVGAMQEDDTAMVEFCLDDTRCGELYLSKAASPCSPVHLRPTDPPSPLSEGMVYTWNGTLTIYANEDSCTTDASPVFVAADFKEGSNVTYTPYQYVTCDGQPVVGATISTSGNTTSNSSSDKTTTSGSVYTQTQMVLMVMLILFAFSI